MSLKNLETECGRVRTDTQIVEQDRDPRSECVISGPRTVSDDAEVSTGTMGDWQ